MACNTSTSCLSNSAINKMKKEEIVQALAALKLNPRGNKEEVSKRLKSYWKRRRNADKTASKRNPAALADRFYDFLCVIDFECTCEDGELRFNYPHEIIEFPAVLLRTSTREVVDEFHDFCKPSVNPILSRFCTELTGITQDQVDAARPFLPVFNDFMEFLRKHELGTKYRFAFVTDGSADFGKFLQLQCQHSSIPIPHSMRNWINIRRSYCRFTHQHYTNLQKMLNDLGMEFSGRMHSGLDDSRNIARITIALLEMGYQLSVNERLLRRDRLEAAGKEASPVQDNEMITITDAIRLSHEKRNRSKSGGPDRASGATVQRQRLPYKSLPVSKKEFLDDVYEQCYTCDEEDGEEGTD